MVKKLGLKLKEQKGFTLIELLAVIVILGIIAAIAIPAITGVMNKSEKKASAQEGIAIINAAKMYVAENPTTPEGDLDLTAADNESLDEYLEKVEDEVYTVTVDRDGTAGKFSFTLKDHKSNIDLDDEELTEEELVDFAN